MAASTDHPKHNMEKHFVQHLAANEKKIRDRAVKKLSRWMTARSGKDCGFDEEELLRIWKGLHYCMWMSDKMLIQEDLADSLSEMIHSLNTPEQGLLYFETFLMTMKKEWNGIDYLRVDKYLMLYRRIFRQALILVKKQGWEESYFKSFMDILQRHPLHTSQRVCPDGLRFFLLDIYVEEISRIGGEELTKEQVLSFLEPLVKLATHTNAQSLTSTIMVTVFEEIVNQAWLGQQEDEEEIIFESFEEKNKSVTKEGVKVFEELPMLEFDHMEIKDMLVKYASEPNIQSRNRKRIYKTIFLYRNLLNGYHPSKLMKEDRSEIRDDEFLRVDNPKLAAKAKLKKPGKERKKKKRMRKRLEKQAMLESGKKGSNEGSPPQEEDGSLEHTKEDGEMNGADRIDEEEVVVLEEGWAASKLEEEKGRDRNGEQMNEKKIEDDHTRLGNTGLGETGHGEIEILDLTEDNDEKDGINKSSNVSQEVQRKTEVTVEDGLLGEEDGDERMAAPSQEEEDVIPKRKSKRKSSTLKKQSERVEVSALEMIKMDDRVEEETRVVRTPTTRERKSRRKSALERGEVKEQMDAGRENSGDEEKAEIAVISKRSATRGSKRKPQQKNEREEDQGDAEEGESDARETSSKKQRGRTKAPAESQVREGADRMEIEQGEQEDVPRKQERVKRKSSGKRGNIKVDSNAGVKDNSVSMYTPPVLRKRVKIALAENQEVASTDYHRRVKASPGIPFDKEKKPESPAIKASPSPTKRTMRSGSTRRK